MNEKEVVKEESGMSLADIWHILVRNVWLIIIATILCGGAAGVYGYAIKDPTYISKASVMIQVDITTNSNNENNNGIVVALRLTETTAELMKSDRIAKETSLEVYGDEKYYKAIKGGLTITPSTTNLMLPISYETTDKENAQLVLNKLIENTRELVNAEENKFDVLRDRIVVVDSASEASYASPNKTLILALGVAAGAVIGIAISFVKELVTGRVLDKKMIEEKTGLRVIGLIPDYEKVTSKFLNGGKN